MTNTEQVTFSRTRVRDGSLALPQVAAGYLQVLAAACGRPLITTPAVAHMERDWSDYDYPREQETYTWGDESYGLRALLSGQFVQHGRRVGELSFWVFLGLPDGLKVRGEAKLHPRWHSHARLSIEAPAADAATPLIQAFRTALAPEDLRNQPDGEALAALEEVLTLLCWYGSALDDPALPALLEAAQSVPITQPAGTAVHYLRACMAQATGNLDQAAQLLEALVAQGESLEFSHGIQCNRTPDGAPGQVVWQDDFPPAAVQAELRLGLDWVRERQAKCPLQTVRVDIKLGLSRIRVAD